MYTYDLLYGRGNELFGAPVYVQCVISHVAPRIGSYLCGGGGDKLFTHPFL